MRQTRLRRFAAVVVIAASAVVVWPQPAAAHGVGGRTDLPIPAWQLAWAASFAVAASFVALGMFWETPRLQAAARGRALPGPLQALLRALGATARFAGVGLLALVLYAALRGNVNPSVNIAPVAVYILFWVGLQAVSVLLGDVWRALNPYITLADMAARLRGRLTGSAVSTPDHGAGNQWWAVAAVFSFVWLELAYHDSSEPRALGVYIAAYTAVMLTGAACLGRGWARDADGFGVLFTKLSAVSPLHKHDGAWRLRAPLSGLAALPSTPGGTAVIMVLLGSTAFDGLTRSSFWLEQVEDHTGWTRTAYSTIGLIFAIGLVWLLYRAAVSVMAMLTGDYESELADLFAPSLLPIAAAYTVAHYFSYLLLEGQQVIAHVSDPFGRGWDLFDTATYQVDYTLISADAIAWVQTAAIALGHVLAVAVAHDFAVARWPRRLAVRSQYPMLAAMIAYTVIGLLLLLGA